MFLVLCTYETGKTLRSKNVNYVQYVFQDDLLDIFLSVILALISSCSPLIDPIVVIGL